MKKINISVLLLSFLFLGLGGCSEVTELEQDSTITEDILYQNLRDLEYGLSGAYSGYSLNSEILFNSVFTDNTKRGLDNLGQYQTIFQFILNSGSDAPNGIWAGKYAVINRVNRLLNGINVVMPTLESDADIAAANEIKGEALALRALAHLDLLSYFTTDYLDPNALSVPYVDYVPENDVKETRNTADEVFDAIFEDLDEADQILNNNAVGDQFYIQENAVKAIKARAYFYRGDYDNALALADQLITLYPLATQEQYRGIFNDESFDEVIFSLARGLDDSQVGGLYYFNFVGIDGGPILEVSNELYNSLDDGDVRKEVIVAVEEIEGMNDDDNIILIGKYPGSVEPLVNDIKVFRSSEMQLIKAESQARNGQLGPAAQTIKELRDVRYGASQPLPTYNTLNDALEDILAERRKELAFEGHRYIDIKRLGEELNQGITRIEVDCTSFSEESPCSLPRSDYRFTLPIPINELRANDLIQQNPGY